MEGLVIDKQIIYPLIKTAFLDHFDTLEFEEHTEPYAGLRMIGKIEGHVYTYDFVLEDWAKLHHAGQFDMVMGIIKKNLFIEDQKRNN